MIRHSSAFLISIILHISLVVLLFVGYKKIFQKKTTTEDYQAHIQIQLCNIDPVQTIEQLNKPEVKQPKKTFQKQTIERKEVQKTKIQVKTTKQMPQEKKSIQPIQPSITPLETEKEKSQRLQEEYLNKHLDKITKLLSDNLYYPRSARKRGITDTIVVKFTLSSLGEVHSLKIIKSQTEVLAHAAMETIKNLSGEFPKPDEALILHVPIEYKLKK